MSAETKRDLLIYAAVIGGLFVLGIFLQSNDRGSFELRTVRQLFAAVFVGGIGYFIARYLRGKW